MFEKHDVKVYDIWDVDGERDPDMPSFIPTGADMIRSWGIYKAWLGGSRYTLTLDDDVRPGDFDLFVDYERAFNLGAVCSPYLSVGQFTESRYEMRGFPYGDRKRAEVAIQYGGWHGTLDYDAATQIATQPEWEVFSPTVVTVPRYAPVTTCIMNAAWRTEYAPIMWQLPMLDGKYNRFGDIWSGLLQKRVLDILGRVMQINGRASVIHERASNPLTNLERELPGIELNEMLWRLISERRVDSTLSLVDTYREVTNWVITSPIWPTEYAEHFLSARDAWLELFAPSNTHFNNGSRA
jgi:hypothetical protein